ncbi:MAG: S8 family serine peptidase [Desulfosoma sp.]
MSGGRRPSQGARASFARRIRCILDFSWRRPALAFALIVFSTLLGPPGWAAPAGLKISPGFSALPNVRASLSAPAAQSTGRLLVRPRADVSEEALDRIFSAEGVRRLASLRRSGMHVVSVPPHLEAAVARALSLHSEIAYAEPDALVAPQAAVPNDPLYPYQWHLPVMEVPTAWDYGTGESVVVAVLDTGVDGTHPDLAASLVPGWNVYDGTADTSDVYGHGTEVAGVIAAAAGNGVGSAGIAPGALIMPVRISRPDGLAYLSTIAEGLVWAADHGARVANVSYMVSGSAAVSEAAWYFRRKGGLVFASAGNTGTYESLNPNPAIIDVAATTPGDARADWSSYGTYVDLAAPGENIVTTTRGGGYAAVSGTSFSAPAAAAAAALLFSANPSLSADQAEGLLKGTALDMGIPGPDPYYGFGRLQAAHAVVAARETPSQDAQPPRVAVTWQFLDGEVGQALLVGVQAEDDVIVSRVALYANGALVGEAPLPLYVFLLDATVFGQGPLTLTAKAWDAAGHEAGSEPVTVMLAHHAEPLAAPAPGVIITAPAGGAQVSGKALITMEAAPNTQIVGIQCIVDGELKATVIGPSLRYPWDTSKAAAGPHDITAVALDSAGKVRRTTITVFTEGNPDGKP